MLRKLLILILMGAASLFAEEIDTSWTAIYNGPADSTDRAVDLAIDKSGNVYVTGSSYGGASKSDYATIKYSAAGNEIWVKRYDGQLGQSDIADALAVDTAGNIYVTGEGYNDTLSDFQDYLTIKYNPSGDSAWVHFYDRGGSDFVHDIAVDPIGVCYVTGAMSPPQSPAGTIKYLSDGDTAWVRKYNGVSNRAGGIALDYDDTGYVYVGGWFRVDLASDYDILTIKYKPNGDTAWVRLYDGPEGANDACRDIAVDPYSNVYVSGLSENASGYFDFVLLKYDSIGNELWTARYPGEVSNQNENLPLAVDDLGNCYICGPGYYAPYRYYTTIKYLPDGDTAWVRIDDDSHGSYYPRAITLDDYLNVYVTGSKGTVKYDKNGNLLWDTGSGYYYDIEVDQFCNVYVTGPESFPSAYDDYVTRKYKIIYITSPSQNELAVPVNTHISVTFPMDMNPNTFEDSISFVVNATLSGRHWGEIAYDSTTNTATFDPAEDFAPGEVVTVVLTKDIQTITGTPLENSFTWSFTTDVDGGSANLVHDADYFVNQNIYDPVAFYFDGDEWIDIAVVGDSLYVLQNNGAGSFEVSVAYDVGTVRDLVAADFDANGCTDLATVDYNSERVLVFLNACNGSFLPYTDYIILPSYPRTLTAFDIEGDGDIDLAAAGDTGAVAILTNDGIGNFSQDIGKSFDAGNNISDIAAADLDNNGFMDLMILDSGVSRLNIYMNDGVGNFTIDTTYSITIGFRFVHMDINNDEYEDIFVSSGTPLYTVLWNEGNGRFSVYSSGHGEMASYVTFGDFDDDTDFEYALSSFNNFCFYILFDFGGVVPNTIPSLQKTNSGIESADVDNDGDLDIITSEIDSGHVSIFLNQRAPTNYYITPVDSADLYYVQSADLDRDNYLDVAYTGSIESGLFVAYGDPDDTLTEPIKYLDINQAALTLQYFNEDSLIDIIAVTSSNLYILENLGNRYFDSSSVPLKMNSRDPVPALSTGLLNGDIDFDIVLAPDQVQFGDGYGGFLGSPVTLPFSFETVAVGDFDHDGSDDLLITDGDYVKIYINSGSGTTFTPGASELLGAASLEIPPTSAVTDFNRDHNLDFALVQPMTGPPSTSKIFIGLGNGSGTLDQFSSIDVSGVAYDLLVTDVDRDVNMDIVIANGTLQRIEIYYGDGIGGFSDPEYVELPAGTDITYVLSTIDLNRDGLPDYISGGPDGDYMNAVIDEGDGSTETLDEMVVTGYTSITLEIINPDGHVISQYYQTVPGADYWRYDVNDDGFLEEETYDYNLQYGEYTIIIRSRPGTGGEMFDVGVRIDGTYKATTHLNYAQPKSGFARDDSLVFYYMVETESSIKPGNGIPTSSLPTFDWSGLVEPGKLIDSFQFQLDRFMDFPAPLYDIKGLSEPTYMPPVKLGVDSVFYWHFRSFSAAGASEYSRTFAAYIAYEVCGDANTDTTVNISDAVWIINYVFAGGDPPDPLEAGDVNCDGTCNISDAVWIINYVFAGGYVPCDTDGDEVPDC